MVFILVIVGSVFLAGIIYLAISRKSSVPVRFTALGALALMILTVIICLLIIFGVIETKATVPVVALPDAPPSAAPAASGPDIVPLVLVIVFLLALFVLVMFLSMREQKRMQNNIKPKPKSNW